MHSIYDNNNLFIFKQEIRMVFEKFEKSLLSVTYCWILINVWAAQREKDINSISIYTFYRFGVDEQKLIQQIIV